MSEQPKAETPAYMKKSQYALNHLNETIGYKVKFMIDINYMNKAMLAGNHAQGDQIAKQLPQLKNQLAECERQLRACQEVYEQMLKEEAEGKLL